MAAFESPVHETAPEASAKNVAHRCLDVAASNLDVMRRTLAIHGNLSLREYLRRTLRPSPVGLQSRADLVDAVREQAESCLGPEIAARVAGDLDRLPLVLTANHHGVDFFAQSLQSSLAFTLRDDPGHRVPSTVPVLACSAVPLNNLTYPRGLLVYRTSHPDHAPLRLPMFPDRMKHRLVCATPAIDADSVVRAGVRAERLLRDGTIHPSLELSLRTVLQEDYADASVLQQSRYSDQSVILNHRLWKRMFASPADAPDLVYLELEGIAARLLTLDLIDTHSLVWRVFFDAGTREAVLRGLDGQRGCWDRAVLGEQWASQRPGSRPAGGGTVFFWGIDDQGRGVALDLHVGAKGAASLQGRDRRGRAVEFPFNPVALVDAVRRREIVPSLFTSYLAISLARGINCVGGYYQAEYLPAMQRTVVRALEGNGAGGAIARAVSLVPTSAYLSGMQAVMSEVDGHSLVPTGALEIIAKGGLSASDLERVAELTVAEAHLASVVETVLDASPEHAGGVEWRRQVGLDLRQALGRRVVVQ